MVIGILTCVNYGDQLYKTLKINNTFFDKLFVLTTNDDIQTHETCKQYKNVEVLTTNCFFENQSKFNKSKALNVGLRHIKNTYPNVWVCILDADVILPSECLSLDIKTLDKDCIYSFQRNRGNSNVGKLVIGYFQLFHSECSYYKEMYDETFTNAAGGDILFSAQWPKTHNIFLQGVIEHTSEPGVNWFGIEDCQKYESQIQDLLKEKKQAEQLKSQLVRQRATQTQILKQQEIQNKRLKQTLHRLTQKANQICLTRAKNKLASLSKTIESQNVHLIKSKHEIQNIKDEILQKQKQIESAKNEHTELTKITKLPVTEIAEQIFKSKFPSLVDNQAEVVNKPKPKTKTKKKFEQIVMF